GAELRGEVLVEVEESCLSGPGTPEHRDQQLGVVERHEIPTVFVHQAGRLAEPLETSSRQGKPRVVRGVRGTGRRSGVAHVPLASECGNEFGPDPSVIRVVNRRHHQESRLGHRWITLSAAMPNRRYTPRVSNTCPTWSARAR